jgi:hypothetical protein
MKKLTLIITMALGVMSCKKHNSCECRTKKVTTWTKYGAVLSKNTVYTDYSKMDCASNGKQTNTYPEPDIQQQTVIECK